MKVSELKIYKKSLYGSKSRDLADFEKNFLIISAGVLTFSITFIKDLVNIENAVWLNVLFISWTLFIISIGLIIFAFIKSALESDKLWNCVNDFLNEKQKYKDDEELSPEETETIKSKTDSILNKSKLKLNRIRFGSIALFLTGMISFGFFVGINIANENQTKKSDEIPTIKFSKQTNEFILEEFKISINDSLIQIKKINKKKN